MMRSGRRCWTVRTSGPLRVDRRGPDLPNRIRRHPRRPPRRLRSQTERRSCHRPPKRSSP
jgi:hypothetical protein